MSTLPSEDPKLHLRHGVVVRNHVNGRHYRVIKLLGRGGFGVAYRVIELSKSRQPTSAQYCLKITANPLGWHREAYFGDLLRGVAGVIQVHDLFAWVPARNGRQPLYCLITEFAEGGDLASWLERTCQPWKERKARSEIIKLLRTVARLHLRGAVHRDITPSNVFVTADQVLKLGDFGIAAHRFDERHVPADVFARWLAPPGIVDGEMSTWRPADDVYHLGQVFAMLLCGSAESKLTVRDVKNLCCTPEAKSVIQRCIGPRKKRFTDAATMLAALEKQEPPAPNPVVRSLEGKRVVFTGRLSIRRANAARMVKRAGGIVERRVCHRTDVLVIGEGSPHWKAEKKGQKLLDLDLELELGHRIAKINESRFRVLTS